MGEPKPHPPVKLICGMISAHKELFDKAASLLQEKFGSIDLKSYIIPFNFTDYYAEEMGENLKRIFISFQKLIWPEDLAEIKLQTNQLERKFLYPGTERRMINLDPGYVAAGKLVLATTKDHSHRVYLGKGIFAEATLRYYKGSFRPWEWTYPDYRTEEYIQIFNQIRKIYMRQLREIRGEME
ncbi:DUF4416 family protein [Candidatus Poribacteria bacterium]|nr:DUF4416 family protein [Candidatus Poribacteria bacterium]